MTQIPNLTPPWTAPSGRVFTHTREPNGSQSVSPSMSMAEWEAYLLAIHHKGKKAYGWLK